MNVAETISMSLDEDLIEAANPIGDVEVPDNGFENLRLRGPRELDILAGLGFSLAVHATVLVLAVLSILFFLPHCSPEAPFAAVTMVHLVGFGDGREGEQNGSGGVADGPELTRTALRGPSPTEDVPEKKTEMRRATAPRLITEPGKPLRTLRKAVAPKDKERVVKEDKSVPQPSGEMDAEQGESSISPVTPPSPSRLSSPGDGVHNDDGYGNRLDSGGTGGGDIGSGGGSAGGGLRGGRGGGGKELDLDQVDIPPTAIRKVEPEFPREARRMGIAGRVAVRFLVKIDGSVGKASVIEANPRGIFEQSALEAIDRWKFKPGRYRGHAVATWVVLPIQFRLSR